METLLYHVMSTMGCYLEVGVAVSRVLKVQSACGGEVQGNGPKQHPLLPEAAGGLPKLGTRGPEGGERKERGGRGEGGGRERRGRGEGEGREGKGEGKGVERNKEWEMHFRSL